MKTYQATLLPDAQPVTVVGYVSAFPRMPDPGSEVAIFGDPDMRPADQQVPGTTYALVRVRWATELSAINPTNGTKHTWYLRKYPGMPSGETWYLAPAVFDNTRQIYRLAPQPNKHFQRHAKLPAIPELECPNRINVRD